MRVSVFPSVRSSRRVSHRRVVLFEIVDYYHQPLCRLLSFDLRERIAEVFERGSVKRGHIHNSRYSLKNFQLTI
jgi:hypothetical protein